MKFSLTPEFDTNKYPIDFETDYFNIYVVNMGKDYDYTKKGLFEMLSLVFNSSLPSEKTLEVLKSSYNIDINKEVINKMCGFSYGV